jgi:hypothetical protein
MGAIIGAWLGLAAFSFPGAVEAQHNGVAQFAYHTPSSWAADCHDGSYRRCGKDSLAHRQEPNVR